MLFVDGGFLSFCVYFSVMLSLKFSGFSTAAVSMLLHVAKKETSKEKNKPVGVRV